MTLSWKGQTVMGLYEAMLATGLLTTAYVLLFLNVRTFAHITLGTGEWGVRHVGGQTVSRTTLNREYIRRRVRGNFGSELFPSDAYDTKK